MTGRRRLALIAVAALALRGLLLVARGDYIVYDEGYYLLLARSLRAGHGFALNGLPHVSLSPLQPILVAAISTLGLSDLLASRLLGALCGALLVVPVHYLARQWFGQRAASWAALFVAESPGLLTLVPFFPGAGWNLYFGSEPLYLLLAVGSMAAGWRAVREERAWWFALSGALAALSYLARLEGAVLGAALAAAMLLALWWRASLRKVRVGLAVAAVVSMLIVAPYLGYLHRTLGRWAVSGRVQSAQVDAPPPPQSAAPGSGRSSAVNAFVWGGDREALWNALYALDASGTRMASQYWGVPTRRVPSPPAPERTGVRRSASPEGSAPAQTGTFLRALLLVAPGWFLIAALGGVVMLRRDPEPLMWIVASVFAITLPAALTYVEPRALLLIVPVSCALATGAILSLGDWLARRYSRPRLSWVPAVLVAIGLTHPTGRDLVRAWRQDTPLQQVATARRAVGEYLGAHLPKDAVIVSWHPAIAIYARREWRVQPYDTFGRIAGYARAQGAAAIVLSRFEPSPLRNPPAPFTAVLVDAAGPPPGDSIRLDRVAETPLLFVGRLAARP